jgi:hypothetical protein
MRESLAFTLSSRVKPGSGEPSSCPLAVFLGGLGGPPLKAAWVFGARLDSSPLTRVSSKDAFDDLFRRGSTATASLKFPARRFHRFHQSIPAAFCQTTLQNLDQGLLFLDAQFVGPIQHFCKCPHGRENMPVHPRTQAPRPPPGFVFRGGRKARNSSRDPIADRGLENKVLARHGGSDIMAHPRHTVWASDGLSVTGADGPASLFGSEMAEKLVFENKGIRQCAAGKF